MLPRVESSGPKKLLAVFFAPLLVGCETGEPMGPPEQLEAIGVSTALGLWSPSGTDTCSREIHDQYRTVGPDGLVYPTWHPPVDPVTGCTFGHEHGRDPSGSALHAEVGPIPFGYANQHLVESGFGAPRNEDHVGHKVEWENGMEMQIGGGGSAAISVRCDVLTKLHQGTHSPDAFTNNLHELVYHIRCTDGTGFSMTLLTPIGTPGEMVVGCDRERHIDAGTATPAISPDGGGKRALPESACIQQHVFRPNGERPRFDSALHESWEVSASLRRADGRTLASVNPYYQVLDPSRYFDPGLERSLGRPIDLCAIPGIAGRDRCEGVPASGVAWDDPRSPFKGARRFVDINGNNIRNADGPTVWFTDPLGRRGQTEPFPGSIRQWVARRDNSGIDLHGPTIGRNRSYDGTGVHAPN
jgi:hypothetical protein